MNHTILAVEGLTKYYNGYAAVNDISFQVQKGEILGFLGPNGAGKTTAIRMILGILAPNAGKIQFYFSGSPGPLDKKRIGYLPEERGLYDDAKVLDSLVYLAALKGTAPPEGREKALNWLEIMNLRNYAHHKLEKLSKGMQQKVQFIATVLHQPDLVVLDEPFSGLDPINQDLFKELILQLREAGITVLLSAHQMNVVQELCDRIFLIDKGAPVLSGTLEEIRDQHEENSVEISFSAAKGLEDYLRSLGDARDISINGNTARLKLKTATDPNSFLANINSLCALKSIKIEKPSLHEIFIDTIGRGSAQ
ncbi:MAG: ATP-binding cassette domain-containing protein [Eubacteriales bacterium]|nr:ATP-binding cassette domain-containing protein [Eubacteriales bacterium]